MYISFFHFNGKVIGNSLAHDSRTLFIKLLNVSRLLEKKQDSLWADPERNFHQIKIEIFFSKYSSFLLDNVTRASDRRTAKEKKALLEMNQLLEGESRQLMILEPKFSISELQTFCFRAWIVRNQPQFYLPRLKLTLFFYLLKDRQTVTIFLYKIDFELIVIRHSYSLFVTVYTT